MHPQENHSNGRRSRATALVAAAAAIAALGTAGLALAASGGSSGAAAAAPVNTVAGLKKAKWGTNVKITYGKASIRYRSNGLPNHARQVQYALPNDGVRVPSAATAHAAADPTKAQPYDFTIPTNPKKAASVTATSLGTIGVMISGAALFNPYEGDGSTVATAGNFTVKNAAGDDVAFLDTCSGHPTPMGDYHYHALPTCITAKVDTKTGPSHLIGLAFDGFPIYGDRDINGNQITKAKLDKCNGITSATPEFPKGIYHYVLLKTKDSRSSIRCFSGKVNASLVRSNALPGLPGGGRSGSGLSLSRATRNGRALVNPCRCENLADARVTIKRFSSH